MPLFSEHISNMYYGGSPSYSSASYNYGSSVSPYGVSYSASYLNPGGSYSSHSSLGGYSRTPLTSRWINSGRTYSPMLGTISERGTSSPVRINSPRSTALSKRTYGTPTYTPKPININTADIDVSRDRYQNKTNSISSSVTNLSRKGSLTTQKENSPFMPRVEEKPETGVDSSPGVQRTTIKRGRTVVRLHTVKRKDRDSPKKPTEQECETQDSKKDIIEEPQHKEKLESERKWREKLAEDLVYKDKKEKKTLGEKLVEKFKLKDRDEAESETVNSNKDLLINQESLQLPVEQLVNQSSSKSPDRRCSMELLAEQAILLDSLIRKENLSTTPLDLSKVGSEGDNNEELTFHPENLKRRKTAEGNQLTTTKSDHSLHDRLNSFKDNKNFPKRRSIKKSSSGGSICRLDSITEFPKEISTSNLPGIDESKNTLKDDKKPAKPKPKLKTKITSSVEVSTPSSPLRFRIENVTVVEKPRPKPKKEILFTSAVDEISTSNETSPGIVKTSHRKSFKSKRKSPAPTQVDEEILSPEPEDGNFWNKIGKRETVYLMKRKKILEESKQKNLRGLLWFTEDDESNTNKESGIGTTDLHFDEQNNQKKNCEQNEIIDTDVSKQIQIDENIPTKLVNAGDNNSKQLQTQVESDLYSEQNKSIESEKSLVATEIISNDHEKDINIFECNVENSVDNPVEIEKTKNETIENMTKDKIKLEDTSNEVINSIVSEISCLEKNTSVNESNSNLPENLVVAKEIPNNINLGHTNDILSSTIDQGKNCGNIHKKEPQNLTSKVNSTEVDNSEINFKKSEKTNDDTGDAVSRISGKENDNVSLISDSKEKVIEKNTESTILLEQKVVRFSDATINDNTIQETDDKKDGVANNVNDTKSLQDDTNDTNDKKDEVTNNVNATKAFQADTRDCIQTLNDKKIEVVNNVNATKALETDISDTIQKISDKKDEVANNVNATKALQADTSDTNQKLSDKKDEIVNNLNATKSIQGDTNDTIQKLSDKKVKVTNNANATKLLQDDTNTVELQKGLESSNILSHNNISTKVNDSKPQEICSTCNKIIVPKKITKAVVTNVKDVIATTGLKNMSPKSTQKEDQSLIKGQKPLKNRSGNNILVKESPIKKKSSQNVSNKKEEEPKSQDTKKASVTSDVSTQIENIPSSSSGQTSSLKGETEEDKAEKALNKDGTPGKAKDENNLPLIAKKPVKQQLATKVLIATPRPLQKRKPQVIRSASSSETSSDEDTSEEEETEESDSSEGSAEFFECENNGDGRTSTGSNDSGFDSSAPTSPAGFVFAKKDCDVNCHRKCEKLTANLCGVNQRLLVEALACRSASRRGGESPSTSAVSPPNSTNAADFLERELEQSTAYGLFRKTGRFTPPARSIPRFRKYTIEDFQFIKVLGKGSFGKVLLAELRDTEYYYAVKCLKKDVVLEDDDVECTLIERKVLALGTNHPYLCHLFATFQTDSHLFFVMEYLNGGDLMFHIQQSGRFPEARARFYAAEIVSGLKFLHKRGIIYRDLKLDNILLDFDGHVRIADFGMCKLQIYLDKTADTFCGTPDYMAPEILKGLKYNQTVDWWSFGVLLYEMLIGQSPFSGCDEDELFWSICNEMPSYPRFLSKESLSILTRLLDKDARTRLGGTECMHGDIRDQEFFQHIHWDRLERRELEAPFKPRVRHPMDTQYFDRAFTGERPRLTAVEPQVLRSMNQEPFRGFSYTNPNATDR